MNSNSASSITSKKHDVFLSFRGTDTRYNFISHLYHALEKAKVNSFMDKQLERGEEITSALAQTIECSTISVVVFSQNYASSTYCLDELEKIIECKESRRQIVLPIFYNVDPTEVEKHSGYYGKSFAKHELHFPESLEKVKKWKLALAKAANLSGWHIDTCKDDEAEFIESIVRTVLKKLHNDFRSGAFVMSKVVGETIQGNMEMILECLQNDEILRIGIYGMGGVGKTTLMTHVCNILSQHTNTFVYWVTVSQDFSIYKLQNCIAEEIQLEFSGEGDERKRASLLSNALEMKGKCILILDDLWNRFSEEDVGIPIRENGCKLILTSRSLSVCRQMFCQKKIRVETLTEEEAWNLFVEKVGRERPDCLEIDEIAKSVVKECAGLPLGVLTMAGSIRGVDDVHEWRHVLKELKESKIRQYDMQDKVFRILRRSYNMLNDLTHQRCFLYCALYPEGYMIKRWQLIEYLIVEGLIENTGSRQQQYDKGHAIINTLENVCLLDGCRNDKNIECVKMHDLIRDMTLQTMKSGPEVAMVEAGKQLKEIPEMKHWTEDLVRVSLMKNEILEISHTLQPRCPNLITLLLDGNSHLNCIPNSFFCHMQKLKVLDLSDASIKELPNSVTSLTNLTALLLSRCECLIDVPSLAKLTALEKLDLSCTRSLRKAPEGMELLPNLRFLNLFFSNMKELPKGILPKLPLLQFLGFDFTFRTSKNIITELTCLQKLETLFCWFHNVGHFYSYIRSPLVTGTRGTSYHYNLLVGEKISKLNQLEYYEKLCLNPQPRDVYFKGIKSDEIHIPRDVRMVDVSWVKYGRGLCLENANKLKSLKIKDCTKIKCLSGLSSSHDLFQSLQEVQLVHLEDFHSLFRGGHSASSMTLMTLSANGAFSHLKTFRIESCNGIKKLFYPALLRNLQNLQVLEVEYCSQLAEIIAAEGGGADGWGSISDDQSTSIVNEYSLPKLRILKLEGLPELMSICGGKLICNSLEDIEIRWCEKLKNIAFPLTLPSLRKIKVYPEEWWKSVLWDHCANKYDLQQFLVFKKYH